jgi:hypothetical protein
VRLKSDPRFIEIVQHRTTAADAERRRLRPMMQARYRAPA